MADLHGLLSRLIEHEVRFVIVGGFAAVAHGSTLVTQDIDICCDFSADNLLRIQKALADLHPVHRMTPQRLPLTLTETSCVGLKNLYLDTDCGQLDCIGEVTALGNFDECLRRSIEVEIGSHSCRLLSLSALIEAKEGMDRPRDREAALQLKAIRERIERDSQK